MRSCVVLFLSIVAFTAASGQSVNVPMDEDYMHKAERYRVLTGEMVDDWHPSFRPYHRQKMVDFLNGLDREKLGKRDQFNLDYLLNDSWEYSKDRYPEGKRPVLKRFYRSRTDLFHVAQEEFQLHVNPVLYFMGGKDGNDENTLFINTRGVEMRSMIDDKIGLYSFIGENQMSVPLYVDRYAGRRLPGIGFQKPFKTDGYDFFTVRGYLSFQATDHVNIQFGYDRFKIGQGMRSLFLSDFSPNYLFMKVQTNIWKLNYTNLFAQHISDRTIDPSTGSYPLKYLSLHHLSLNLGRKVNIGLFEAVVHGGGGQGFDPKYYNPIIFYRAIEHQTGSADNVIVGMDWEWLVIPSISFYGQFVMDEFLLSEIKARDGWWANKFGLQLGANYFNTFGIDNLDLRLEWNGVRPYTYAHRSLGGSYSNFEQPLAHPLGANFRETLVELRYQPLNRLDLSIRAIISAVGRDDNNTNWGSDILKDYTTREMEYDNKTLQGFRSDILYTRFNASYMFRHNLFADLTYVFRNEDSALVTDGSSNIIGASLRLNIASIRNEF